MVNRYITPILSPRLSLRPLQPGDETALSEAKEETRESLVQVFEWASKGFNRDQDRAYVAQAWQDFQAGKDLSLVGSSREMGQPVIWTGLHDSFYKPDTYQIGFWVRQSAQGQRLAAESTNALIRYAFDVLAARKVVMCHSEFNQKSRAIFNALGFEYDELRPQSLRMAGGRIVDAHWYKLDSPHALPSLHVRWGPESI